MGRGRSVESHHGAEGDPQAGRRRGISDVCRQKYRTGSGETTGNAAFLCGFCLQTGNPQSINEIVTIKFRCCFITQMLARQNGNEISIIMLQ